tara:strand:- start:371 stop:517 length:147 start_codon:yes stop_codon:yes gene_type:complete
MKASRGFVWEQFAAATWAKPWKKNESKEPHQCVKLFFMEKSLRFVQDR